MTCKHDWKPVKDNKIPVVYKCTLCKRCGRKSSLNKLRTSIVLDLGLILSN